MKCIIVTGVSSGIGFALANRFCQLGFRVFGSVRNPSDAEKLSSEFGNNFVPLLMDVTKPGTILHQAEAVRERMDPGDSVIALINNAGIATGGPLLYFDPVELRQQLEVNLIGLHQVTLIFFPILQDYRPQNNTGRIINISSVAGRRVLPFMGPYSASKFALEAYSDALRMELIPHNMDVVLVEPGPVQSAIWTKKPDSEENPYVGTEYESALHRFNKLLVKKSKTAMPASEIVELVEKIINVKKPKSRYLITKNPFKNYYLMKFLPARLVDKFITKAFGLDKFEE